MAQGEDDPRDVSNAPDTVPPSGSSEDTDNEEENSTIAFTDVSATDVDTPTEDSGIGQSSDPPNASSSDLKHPIPATDYFTGPTAVQTEEGGLHVSVAAASASAKRHTSISSGLDQLSVTTVRTERGTLSVVPGENRAFFPDTSSYHLNEEIPATGLCDPQVVNFGFNPSSNYGSLNESFDPFHDEETGHYTSEGGVSGRENNALANSFAAPGVTGRRLTQVEIHEKQLLSGTWRDHDYNEFALLSTRLETFPANGVLDGVTVDRQMFAECGFFFKLKEGLATVICYHCGCSPRQWERGMDPKTEHILLTPRCRAVFP